MALQTVSFRAGTLALVKETEEGVPVKPTAGNQFTAIQPDISLTPGLETLTNEELKNSIVPGKSIVGREAPTISLSHYYRSGEAGAKPDYSLLMEAAFGAVNEVAVETTVSSVVDNKTFDVADGTEYQKGDILLLQLSSGNELRPIADVTADTITLAFETENAINVGALIGKPITYNALDDSNLIPTLSSWYFLPNTIEMIAGTRIEGVDITFPAGELINTSFSGSGLGFYFDPLVVDATNDQVTIEVSSTPYTGALPQTTSKDPHQVAEALTIVMNNMGTGETFTVEYNDAGGFVVTCTNNFAIDGTIANNVWLTLGFDAVLTAEATEHSSVNQIDLTEGVTPVYDDSDPLVAKGNIMLIGNPEDNACVHASNVDFSLANTKADLLDICAESGVGASIFNERTGTVSVTSYLQPFEARYFRDMRKGQKVSFFYGAGEKLGGQFIKEKCVGVYISHATITSLEIADQDGVAQLNLELSAYSPEDSSQPIFAGFV